MFNAIILAALAIGAIMALVGNELVEQTLEYIQVFRAKTVPGLRGHSEQIGSKCYSIYSTRVKTWYIGWGTFIIGGWSLLTVGAHFATRLIIEMEPSMGIWYWPIMLFAVILGIGVFASNMHIALSLQEKEST